MPTSLSDWITADLICPDLRDYWTLSKLPDDRGMVLRSLDRRYCYPFSEQEGLILRYFTGNLTVQQVQDRCQQDVEGAIAEDAVVQLIQRLIELGIIADGENQDISNIASSSPEKPGLRLKPDVQWIENSDGHWVLRNGADFTFFQANADTKAVIDQLERYPVAVVMQQLDLSKSELRTIFQGLAATAMLEGTTPPQRPRGKFNPLQLLSFKKRLFNPDAWLSQHAHRLTWLWHPAFAWGLVVALSASWVIGLDQWAGIVATGAQIWATDGSALLLPFGMLAMLVVTIHELGHAFTLKHYGGIVPEVGLLFMCLMPSVYTNTTDQYILSRKQRLLVVGAGILCQVAIASLALWMWNFSSPGSWLWLLSYILMTAALFTLALNLNPLARFDGYYLTVALTGINNLRSRSLQLYRDLLCLRPSPERGCDRWILALYAPVSLLYTVSVFGFLLWNITSWTLTYIPITALLLLSLWAIYYVFVPQR